MCCVMDVSRVLEVIYFCSSKITKGYSGLSTITCDGETLLLLITDADYHDHPLVPVCKSSISFVQ